MFRFNTNKIIHYRIQYVKICHSLSQSSNGKRNLLIPNQLISTLPIRVPYDILSRSISKLNSSIDNIIRRFHPNYNYHSNEDNFFLLLGIINRKNLSTYQSVVAVKFEK
ncbi:hypothetical protein SSS_07731 [Sarcoptes scabiei]|nr:hypothetical protein SSS_07731 [Sarcoptes scabiei]